MAKKIRFTVPYNVYKIILEDIEDFEICNNNLLNSIFHHYKNKKILVECIKSDNSKQIQFNLWKKSEDVYNEKIKENNIEIQSEYFRNIVYAYTNQPKYLRERLLKEKIVNEIENSIKSNKKLKIFYDKNYRTVEPYFLIGDGGESRNYLFCYCQKNSEYRNYRLQKIEKVLNNSETQEMRDKKYINQIRKNFDPYLSYGKTVKVRLTEIGIKLLEINKIDKPKLIESNENIFIFEASIFKAKKYFSTFFENVEILEPIELRYWFAEKIKNNLQIYEKYIKK